MTRAELLTGDPADGGDTPAGEPLVARAEAPPSPRESLSRGLLRTARPRQWVKNLLVFAAPGAAGVLTEADAVLKTLAAFGLFCLAASGAYFLNDAFDVAADRQHPTKRLRPIPAGSVGVGVAKAVGAGLLMMSVGGAFLVAGWPLTLVLGAYVALQPLYSLWLKHVVVVDIAAVASGFLIRAIAGGVAVDVPISSWFLTVAGFGSLFMVAGKRHAEHLDLGDDRGDHRPTLDVYSSDFLRYVRSVSSSVAIAAYCLWAFEKADLAGAPVWFQLSIVPFVLGVLRYGLLLETGRGGAPEELVLQDRTLQVLGALWLACFAVGVHVA
ncbi:MAG TPA: decaprenyl-phosphate phosphoribosyltransferase [Acidimicrobiales bacterium]|nr:decaprenyl-phosphate phosphoribosyltransferase [Acidimicrobiales bacterium]